MRKFLILLSVSLFLSDAVAQTTPADLDSDGYSEFPLINIGSDKALNWNFFHAASAVSSSMGQFGESGNHVTLAHWKGTGIPQLGVVKLAEDNKTIVWQVKNDQGEIEQREFGSKKYTVVSGGDFDGDGIADAATAVLKGKKVHWQVGYKLFNTAIGQETVAKLSFGTAGDRIFYASPDGISDWIGTLGKNGKKGVILRAKNLLTGAVTTSTRFPKYAVTGTRPRPFPVKQANGVDLLALARPIKTNTQVEFFNFDGVRVNQATLPGKGDIIVGNYSAAAGEEVAIKTTTGFTIFNPTTGETSNVTAPEGIAADEININTLTAGSSNNGGGNNGGGSAPPSGGNSTCSSTVSWPSSHIYKTIGSTHFTDVRRNTAGVIIKPGGRGPFPGCISVVDTKGQKIANMGLYARGNGWEARYYAGIGCGGSTPYSGSTIASRARSNTGSTYVYMNFDSVCYGPIEATRCIGSSQC